MKPDFFKDEDVAELSFEIRLFFMGLWGLADKEGRLEDRPLRLKAEIFPYEQIDAEKCLAELAKPKKHSKTGEPFILRYQSNGTLYIQILKWLKHQKPHHTERNSNFPAPPITPFVHTMEKIKRMGSVHEASAQLSNGYLTVKQPLNPKEHEQKPEKNNRFQKPTPDEIKAYAKEIDFNLDGQKFLDHYDSVGWVIGKSRIPMKDWKAAVRTWKTKQNERGQFSGALKNTLEKLSDKMEIKK